MAQLLQYVGSDPAFLLRHAAEDFLTPRSATDADPFPTPPTWLFLRHAGLRDDLYTLAWQRGLRGWFDPPLRTFTELSDVLGRSATRGLGQLERAVLLGNLLRRRAPSILAPAAQPEAWIAEVDRIVGALSSEDVTPADFRAACEARPERDEFERNRDGELADVYQAYLAALSDVGRRDGRDDLVDMARVIAREPADLSRRLGGRREVRIVGLMELRGGWTKLLRALLDSNALDRVQLYAMHPLPLPDDLGASTVTLDAPPLADAGVRPAFIVAPDPRREAEEVARRVRERIDAGAIPSQIAILARESRPVLDHVVHALESAGVPAHVRHRQVLRDVPVVRAVRSLFAAAKEGWSRHALAEVAEQPYLNTGLDASAINVTGYAWALSGLDAWEQALDSPAFRGFADRCRTLMAPAPLTHWVDRFAAVLTDDAWQVRSRADQVPGDRYDVVRLDRLGLQALEQLVSEWRQALGLQSGDDVVLDAAGFVEQLDQLLARDISWSSESPGGVVVTVAASAAYRSFDLVYVVGMSNGAFPLTPAPQVLLDNVTLDFLAQRGLPFVTRERWLLHEAQLFDALVRSARLGLVVSAARCDDLGDELGPSAFFEQLQSTSRRDPESVPASQVIILPVGPDAALEHGLYAASVEEARASSVCSLWSGKIEADAMRSLLRERYGEDRVWRPTELEQYAKCPFTYFFGRMLELERREEPEEQVDRRTLGRVRHDALRRIFAKLGSDASHPVFVTQDQLAKLPRLVDAAVDEALAADPAVAQAGEPAVIAAITRTRLTRELLALLHAEAAEHAASFTNRGNARKLVRTGVVAHEVLLDNVPLQGTTGETLRIRGSLDRLETGVDDRVRSQKLAAAVEYKSTEAATPGGGDKEAWDDQVVLQLPLYALALTQVRPDLKLARAEYRVLRTGAAVHRVQPMQLDPVKVALTSSSSEKRKLIEALDAAIEHARKIRDGVFPPAPPPSCNCPPFCHARDICRIPGGPRTPPRR